jgi:hypothetical protein
MSWYGYIAIAVCVLLAGIAKHAPKAVDNLARGLEGPRLTRLGTSASHDLGGAAAHGVDELATATKATAGEHRSAGMKKGSHIEQDRLTPESPVGAKDFFDAIQMYPDEEDRKKKGN